MRSVVIFAFLAILTDSALGQDDTPKDIFPLPASPLSDALDLLRRPLFGVDSRVFNEMMCGQKFSSGQGLKACIDDGNKLADLLDLARESAVQLESPDITEEKANRLYEALAKIFAMYRDSIDQWYQTYFPETLQQIPGLESPQPPPTIEH